MIQMIKKILKMRLIKPFTTKAYINYVLLQQTKKKQAVGTASSQNIKIFFKQTK